MFTGTVNTTCKVTDHRYSQIRLMTLTIVRLQRSQGWSDEWLVWRVKLPNMNGFLDSNMQKN